MEQLINSPQLELTYEAARVEEDSNVSSKGHYNASQRWEYIHFGLVDWLS
jgi:hypothetical protein